MTIKTFTTLTIDDFTQYGAAGHYRHFANDKQYCIEFSLAGITTGKWVIKISREGSLMMGCTGQTFSSKELALAGLNEIIKADWELESMATPDGETNHMTNQITSKQIEANTRNTREIIILNHDAGTQILANADEMIALYVELFRGDWGETSDPRVLAILIDHDVMTEDELDALKSREERIGQSVDVDISGVSDEVMSEIIMAHLYDNDSGGQTVDHQIGDFSTMTIYEWLIRDSDCDPERDEWSDAALALLVEPEKEPEDKRYGFETKDAFYTYSSTVPDAQ